MLFSSRELTLKHPRTTTRYLCPAQSVVHIGIPVHSVPAGHHANYLLPTFVISTRVFRQLPQSCQADFVYLLSGWTLIAISTSLPSIREHCLLRYVLAIIEMIFVSTAAFTKNSMASAAFWCGHVPLRYAYLHPKGAAGHAAKIINISNVATHDPAT